MNARQKMKLSLYRPGKHIIEKEKNLATCSPRNIYFTHVIDSTRVCSCIDVFGYQDKHNALHY